MVQDEKNAGWKIGDSAKLFSAKDSFLVECAELMSCRAC